MTDLTHKHASIKRLVAGVHQRVPKRLVLVEDTAPDDPNVITFVRAADGEELCTVRASDAEPERFDIIDAEMTVPGCLIRGVVWRIRDGLRRPKRAGSSDPSANRLRQRRTYDTQG